MARYFFRSAMLAALFALVPIAGWSKDAVENQKLVQVIGKVEVKVQPTIMRTAVLLSANAETAKKALQKVTKLRKAAKEKMKELGAVPESIEAGPPRIYKESPWQGYPTQGMNMPVNQPGGMLPLNKPGGMLPVEQAGGLPFEQLDELPFEQFGGQQPGPVAGARRVESGTAESLFKVDVYLKGDWPLKTDTPDQLAEIVAEIIDKIAAAKLGGPNATGKPPPSQFFNMDQRDEQMTLYVARIAKEKRSQALAEAVDKAKAVAENLARAAGVRVGKIRRLSKDSIWGWETDTSSWTSPMNPWGFDPEGVPGMENLPDNEIASLDPGPATYSVTVYVDFELLHAAEKGK